MPAEASAQSSDGGGSAAQGAGELPVGGAGLETCGDGDEQLGALEEVGDGEGLLGEGAAAGEASVAWDAATIAAEVGAVVLPEERTVGLETVLGAIATRAQPRDESPLDFNRLNRPVHAPDRGRKRAEAEAWKRRRPK